MAVTPQETYEEPISEIDAVMAPEQTGNEYMFETARSMRRPDPSGLLENEGAREALMALMSGNRTTKEVASALDISPSAASEQLHKLTDAGLVKRGEKVGKFQLYDINDEALNSAARQKAEEYQSLTS